MAHDARRNISCLEVVIEILSPREAWDGKEGSQDDKMRMYMEWAAEGLLINPIDGKFRFYRKENGKIVAEDAWATEHSDSAIKFSLRMKINVSKIIKAYKQGERLVREAEQQDFNHESDALTISTNEKCNVDQNVLKEDGADGSVCGRAGTA
eukprot:TRINITY_DN13707_c0_g1_i1.p1 TRINITY_DN13707_c0_g1~~TRINITY_DN13707_c0_g1_i1.p1  ORF type:complete len:152 (-),score=30.69 TRINITY_DN13707_c0_g1_i1:203-658(-)